MTEPRKYRWLSEGQHHRYSAALGKGDDSRRGQLVQVITVPNPRSRPGNVLVVFGDGVRHIVPAGVLKAVKEVS